MNTNKQSDEGARKGSLGAITAGALLGAGAVLLASRGDRKKMKNMTRDVVKKFKTSFQDNMEKAGETMQDLRKNGRQLAGSAR